MPMAPLTNNNRIRLPVRCIPERAIQTAEKVLSGEFGVDICGTNSLRQWQVEEMAAFLLSLAKEHTSYVEGRKVITDLAASLFPSYTGHSQG